jgi:ArsR family transcriptional regulator
MSFNQQLIPKVVERLRALADENRIRILLHLKDGPANVSTLTASLCISQASVSKHLALLRQAGLLDVRRVGTHAVYRIRDNSIFDLCQILCAGVVRFAQEEHAALSLPSFTQSTPLQGAKS